MAVEDREVRAEVVEEAKTEATTTKVKTIIKIDKDNTTTKETLKCSNNQECSNRPHNRLNQHLSKCSSSQQLIRQWSSCNLLIFLLSILFRELKETNSSETVFTAKSKPLSVTNLLQELLVCFLMKMPVLTSSLSWLTAHTSPAKFMRPTLSSSQASKSKNERAFFHTPVKPTETFQAMQADCKEDLNRWRLGTDLDSGSAQTLVKDSTISEFNGPWYCYLEVPTRTITVLG